jgi:hypothetical protein
MIITLTVCYNNFTVIEKSIDRYYELCYYKPDIHFILDNEYPLNKDRLKETLKKISHKYDCLILEPNKNLGIKNGTNWALDQISLSDNDKIIIYDSNAYPITKHFDKALIDVLENNEDIVGVCLTGGSSYTNNLEKLYDKYSKHYYFSENNFNMGSSIGVFNYYIHKQLKYDIDLYNNYYGDAINLPDSKLKKLLKKIDKKMIFLSDYNENLKFYFNQEDKEYINYKIIAQINSLNDFNLEKYLLNKNKYNKISLINYKIKKINEVLNF